MKHKKKRAITLEEHEQIIAAEVNPERKDFYELLWQTGASQGDAAWLNAQDDIDWSNRTIRFFRQKTGTVVYQSFGDTTAELLRRLPRTGPLFPYLSTVRSGDRATEFSQL